MITFYGLKNCDTCKKAMKALAEAGKSVVFKDVRADGVSKEQITKWLQSAGQKILLNTRSTTWRNLDDSDKEFENDEAVVALLSQHPTLMKRPILVMEDIEVHVGWSKETQTKLL